MKNAEENYREAISEIEDYAFIRLDASGTILDWNKGAEKLKGYTAEEIIGKHFKLFYTSDDRDHARPEMLIRQAVEEGKALSEGWRVRKDGSLFWASVLITALYDEHKKHTGFLKITRDLSERKNYEDSLRKINDALELKVKERTYNLLKVNRIYAFISAVNQSIVYEKEEKELFDKICHIAIEIGKFKMAWIALLDAGGIVNMACVNGDDPGLSSVLRHSGMHQDDPVISHTLTGKALRTGSYSVSNDIQGDPAYAMWRSAFISQGIYCGIALPVFRSGAVAGVFCLMAGSRDFFDEAEIVLLQEAANDVSFALDNFDKRKSRQQAEERMKKSEARLRQAQGLAHIGSWEFDSATRTTLWSAEYCRLFGLAPTDNRHPPEVFMSFVHPDDRDMVSNAIKESAVSLSSASITHRIVRRDGTIRYLQSERRFELDADGKPLYLHGTSYDITDIVDAEKKKHENYALFRGLFESAPQAILIGDCDTMRFIDCNTNAVSLFGYTHDQMLEMTPVSLSPEYQPDGSISAQKAGEMIGRAMAGEKVVFEWVHCTAQGREIECEVRLTRLNIPGRNLISSSVMDIGEKKLAEKKIRRANRLYAFNSAVNQSIVQVSDERQLLERICRIALDIGRFNMSWIGMADDRGRLHVVSACGDEIGVARIKGLSGIYADDPLIRDVPTGIAFRTGKIAYVNDMLNYPAYSPWRDDFIKQGIKSTISLPIFRSGKVAGLFNIQSSQQDFFDEDEIKLLKEAAEDVSFALDNFDNEKKRYLTEQKLQKSESNLRTIFNNTNVGFLLLDMDYNIMDCNQLIGKWSEISMGLVFVKGMNLRETLPEPKFSNFERIMNMLLNGGHVNIEPQYVGAGNSEHWFHINARPVVGGAEEMLGVCFAVTDITEKKRAEKRREFDRNNLHALINNTSDCLWSVDKDFKLITFNQPLYEIVKKATGKELMVGTDVLAYSHSVRQAADYKRLYERAFAGEAFTEVEYTDGPYEFWSEMSFYPIREGDKIIGSACHSRDITARVKAEMEIKSLNENLESRVQARTTELSEANKALEAFSYSVSHDLRAPVRAVLGFTSIIRDEYGAAMDPEVKELFSYIVENGIRMSAIIDDLLKLARSGTEVLRAGKVDMTVLVRDTWHSISQAGPHRAHLNLAELPVIEADLSMMQQVVVNLLSNAVKYSSKKEAPEVKVWCEQAGDQATFFFQDNGAGFDMKFYKTLFKAFQRLHSESDFEGTGVGLSLVKRIIEKHGGSIGAEGRVNEGATFYFTLPVNRSNG